MDYKIFENILFLQDLVQKDPLRRGLETYVTSKSDQSQVLSHRNNTLNPKISIDDFRARKIC